VAKVAGVIACIGRTTLVGGIDDHVAVVGVVVIGQDAAATVGGGSANAMVATHTERATDAAECDTIGGGSGYASQSANRSPTRKCRLDQRKPCTLREICATRRRALARMMDAIEGGNQTARSL